MKDSLHLQFVEGMSFETRMDGHRIVLDADREVGGKNLGPKPKPLMMLALAGCTAMDVVSILRKMRVDFDDFSVEVEGELNEEMPREYKKMVIRYVLKGKEIDRKKVEKAVNLSQDRYCGVTANYRKAMELEHEIEIRE